jgi:predicted nucleic acid-binding protein
VKLLDTIILVSAMNPDDKYHKTGMTYLTTLQSAEETYVPTSTLTEFDLVMRNSEYTESEIAATWTALVPFLGRRIAPTTPSAHLTAAELRAQGLTYFDSLIVALAKETKAVVITRDAEIARRVETEWGQSQRAR